MSEVSVITPVYNAVQYVCEAVESALAQPQTGEVLLIDDGSTDGSLAACNALTARFEKVRLLHHPAGENRGPAASRNVGIKSAECRYIAFLDADDYYLPGRFDRAVPILESNPAVDGVYEAVGTRFETGEMQAWWEGERGFGALTGLSEAVPPDELLATLCGKGRAKGWIGTLGVTVRRSLFDRTGLFMPELRMGEDTAMWMKMAAVGRLEAASLDSPVAVRRLHGENSIFKNQGRVHTLRARSHVFEWALEQGLKAEILQALWHHHFAFQRNQRIADRRLRRLGLRDLPWLVGIASEVPIARSHPKYWQCVREALYLASAKTAVKRGLRRMSLKSN